MTMEMKTSRKKIYQSMRPDITKRCYRLVSYSSQSNSWGFNPKPQPATLMNMHIFHILLSDPTVTLRSTNGTPFKGYLMKVMSSNGVTEGRWGAMTSIQHIVGDYAYGVDHI